MCYAAQPKFNYSAVAELYDALCNQVVGQNLIIFFDLHFGNSMTRTCILDVGGGTGKQLVANQSWFPDMLMVDLDLFDSRLHGNALVTIIGDKSQMASSTEKLGG